MLELMNKITTVEQALDPKTGVTFEHFDLILIRGSSGSGKSTMAKSIKDYIFTIAEVEPNVEVFSSDDFFTNEDGTYAWYGSGIPMAHRQCQESVERHLRRGGSCIVANTFTREFEIAPYLRIAKQFNHCNVCIIDLYTQFDNVHAVPPETVEKQKARFVPCDLLKLPTDGIVGVKIYG